MNIIQISISPVSLKFEVDLECPDVPSKPIMSGQLSIMEGDCLAIPEVHEDLEDMEEVTDVDVYGTLAQFGYELGDEFQTITRLLVTKNGTFLHFIIYTSSPNRIFSGNKDSLLRTE